MSIPCLPSYHQSVSRNKKHEKAMRVLFVNFILLMLYKIKQQETSRYVCFNQYSIHLQIETYLIPFRKLRNFYEKVTEFLQESYRISKSWQIQASGVCLVACRKRGCRMKCSYCKLVLNLVALVYCFPKASKVFG